MIPCLPLGPAALSDGAAALDNGLTALSDGAAALDNSPAVLSDGAKVLSLLRRVNGFHIVSGSVGCC